MNDHAKFVRRALLNSGWVAPIVLGVSLPLHAQTSHTDTPPNHNDTPVHADSHADSHGDTHGDSTGHIDAPRHIDSHGDTHADSHSDSAVAF